ncbi:MAG: type I phosphomannose isomerase catalytic subunit [Eubacterium sp.]|nr:type I phosphomannose isomerase catalytic subunit [Eubacterium sp.]
MYPMKLAPAYKDYLWGGHELEHLFGKCGDGDCTAESWELSCHPDGKSIVRNGAFKGKTLEEVLDEFPEYVSQRFQPDDKFPILIKFIDAKENLSIQVHPSDDTAKSELGEEGKAEMWYVLAAKPHAFLSYGLNQEVSKEKLEEKMRDGSIPEILNKVEVNEGDVFFIHPGTIHAIGAGVVIAEIQQNSNTTFRVYDYLRKDKNGNYRQLHIERGVEVIDRTPIVPSQVFDNNEVRLPHGRIRRLFECDYFCVNKIDCSGGKIKFWCDKTSFQSLLVVKGDGYLEYKGRRYDFKAGDSIFVPAGFGEYYIHGTNEILMSKL